MADTNEQTIGAEFKAVWDGVCRTLADVLQPQYRTTLGLIVAGPALLCVAGSSSDMTAPAGIVETAVHKSGLLAVATILLCNYVLAKYLAAISAGTDIEHKRASASVLSFALFVCLIDAYGWLYLIEIPGKLSSACAHTGTCCPLGFEAWWQRTTNAFYFSGLTITTLGYGDLVPDTSWGRITAALQALNGLIAFGIFTGALTSYLASAQQTGRRRQDRRNGKP